MPNLISVTQTGPDIITPVREKLVETNEIGKFRKAGAILKGNPLSLLISELVFPDPVADGTLKSAIERHGYINAGVDP